MLFYMLIIRTLIAELKQKSAQRCRTLKRILFIPTVHSWAGSAVGQPGDRDACRQPSSHPDCGAAEGWPAEWAAQHLQGGVPSYCSEYHLPPNSASSNSCLPIPKGFGFAHFLLHPNKNSVVFYLLVILSKVDGKWSFHCIHRVLFP